MEVLKNLEYTIYSTHQILHDFLFPNHKELEKGRNSNYLEVIEATAKHFIDQISKFFVRVNEICETMCQMCWIAG